MPEMGLYRVALFVHVSGAIGVCVSLGIWLFGLAALRRARLVEQVRALAWLIIVASPLMVLSVLLLGLAGFEMALSAWGLLTPWIAMSLLSVLLVGPIGAFVLDPRMRTIIALALEMPGGPLPDALDQRTHDPILGTSAHTLVAILLGIVFLMTTKPSLVISILVMGVALFLGLLVSLPFWYAARRRTKHAAAHGGHAEIDPFLTKTRHGRGDGKMRAATTHLFRERAWRESMHISQEQGTPEIGPNIAWPGNTRPSDEGIASSGIAFQLWRLYQHAWLVCLLFPLAQLVRNPLPAWHLVLGGVALVGFAASYTWLMWPHPASQRARLRTRSRSSFLLFVALSVLVLVISVMDDPAWLWLLIGTSAIAGLLLPLRSAFTVVVFFTLFPLFLMLKIHGGFAGVDLWWLIALMLLVRGLGLDMIGVARMGSAIRELQSARRELARLAVIEERERLSRDLHDLLGQTLSMITLKSELARHLVTEEPERCARELSEIERVSRKTLREVREAVAGYRQPTLSSELEGARQLLSAARIDVEIESLNEVLSPAFDAALAWTVREGVTNIIRHSRARQCRIRLTHKNGAVMAEVLSDGGQREQLESTARPGLGLAGLRERVSALGGRMEAGSLTLAGKEHFRVRVELPVHRGGEAPVFQEERS